MSAVDADAEARPPTDGVGLLLSDRQDADATLLEKGASLLRAERYEDAVEVFEQCSSGQSSSARFCMGLGNAYYGCERYSDSSKCFDDALRIGSLDPQEAICAHVKRGLNYARLDNEAEAERHFRLAISDTFVPNCAVSFYLHGAALFHLPSTASRDRVALSFYERAFAAWESGDFLSVLYRVLVLKARGFHFLDERSPSEAINCFTAALKLRDICIGSEVDWHKLLFGRGVCYSMLRQWTDAITDFGRILGDDDDDDDSASSVSSPPPPDHARHRVRNERMRAYVARNHDGDGRNALADNEVLLKATDWGNRGVRAGLNSLRGALLSKMGRFEAAVAAFEAALRLRPGDAAATEGLMEAKHRLQQLLFAEERAATPPRKDRRKRRSKKRHRRKKNRGGRRSGIRSSAPTSPSLKPSPRRTDREKKRTSEGIGAAKDATADAHASLSSAASSLDAASPSLAAPGPTKKPLSQGTKDPPSPPLPSSVERSGIDDVAFSEDDDDDRRCPPPRCSRNVEEIDGVTIYKDDVIGHGAHSIVFRGLFEGQEIAVKRIMKEHAHLVDREVEILRKAHRYSNVNIVRFYARREDIHFVYLVLELMAMTLKERVLSQPPLTLLIAKNVLKQVASAIAFLHVKLRDMYEALRIVHRDIKPHNILLRPLKGGNFEVKLCDMGIAKPLREGLTSLSQTTGRGTREWAGPEAFDPGARKTPALDIFSFGCVMFFVLTGGHHPFGDSPDRAYNIRHNRADLTRLDVVPLNERLLARALVRRMVSHDASERPTITEVLEHPFFWDPLRRLEFLCDISNRMEPKRRGAKNARDLRRRLRSDDTILEDCPDGWNVKVDAQILKQSEGVRRRPYDYTDVVELLRFVRNLRVHIDEYDHVVLGQGRSGLCEYFVSRFPRLFPAAWRLFCDWQACDVV